MSEPTWKEMALKLNTELNQLHEISQKAELTVTQLTNENLVLQQKVLTYEELFSTCISKTKGEKLWA